jgi:hypothetical protein
MPLPDEEVGRQAKKAGKSEDLSLRKKLTPDLVRGQAKG